MIFFAAKCNRDTLCLWWGLNPGPLAYKSNALPMKFKGETREIFSQANKSWFTVKVSLYIYCSVVDFWINGN